MGSSFLKGETYDWLKLERATAETGDPFPPGYAHLPLHAAGEESCRQITAEQLVARTGRNGFRRLKWVKTRERNEALDCRIYARAAAAVLGMDGWGDGRWARMADALSLPAAELPDGGNVASPSPPASPDTHRPRGWLAPRGNWTPSVIGRREVNAGIVRLADLASVRGLRGGSHMRRSDAREGPISKAASP